MAKDCKIIEVQKGGVVSKIDMVMLSFVIGIATSAICATYNAIFIRRFYTPTGFDKERYLSALDSSKLIGAIVGVLTLVFCIFCCNITP